MKETPILFNGPMVRAILAGTKTQTRRVVKPQFSKDAEPVEMGATNERGHQIAGHSGMWWCEVECNHEESVRCPHGQPGDRLWGRETYFAWGRWETRFSEKKGRDEWHFEDFTLETGRVYRYAAEGDGLWTMPGRRQLAGAQPGWWKRPAIFMPRAASRILLEVTDVRVERLQDISEADAEAEGIEKTAHGFWRLYGEGDADGTYSPRSSYRSLWDSINGPGAWDANPWVWVIEFKRNQTAAGAQQAQAAIKP